MRWQGQRESGNVEDRRGLPVRGMAVGGGLGTLLLLLAWAFLGGDPGVLLNQNPAPVQQGGQEDELKKFVAVVLADTEDVWHDLFRQEFRQEYREPKLVLFSGRVESSCGLASAAVGPFYCPADENVYLDLEFFDEMRRRFQASGDFAMAYVIAHEVGHHVQNLLGISEKLQAARARSSKVEINGASVRAELQADFLAGVWAHHAERAKQILEAGDIEEALRAAQAIGDDRLQQQSRGYVVPDSFTHGTSEQRVRWFRRGLETGDVSLMGELFSRDQDEL
jgi:hypothetical protein